MRACCIQLPMRDGRGKGESIELAMSMAGQCRGADLIVLPEMWNIGFTAYERYADEAEDIGGPTMTAVSRKARELGAYIHGGSFVECRDGRLYNTSVLFDRHGDAVAAYSKMHLFSYRSKEADFITPGESITVCDTEFGRVGLSICYDLRFPELFRAQVDMGAEIFITASCWPFPRVAALETFTIARAAENECWHISCNACGRQGGAIFAGHSRVVSPRGAIAAGIDFSEGIVRADIDPAMVHEVRADFPVLDDRVIGRGRQ